MATEVAPTATLSGPAEYATATRPALLLALSDAAMRESLAAGLRTHGYHVFAASTVAEAVRVAEQVPLSLALTDPMFPGAAGRPVQDWVRAQPACHDLQMLWLSPGPLAELSSGTGIDTVVLTPMTPEGVFRAVQRVLHSALNELRTLPASRLTIDLLTFELQGPARSVVLTPTEFRLLRMLLDRRGSTVTYPEFVQALWHEHPIGGAALIRVHMRNLRQKLGLVAGSGRQLIRTVPRVGYGIDESLEVELLRGG